MFPIEEIKELLGVSHDKANNLLKELDDVKVSVMLKTKMLKVLKTMTE